MARLLTPARRIPAALVALFAGLAVGVAGAAQHSGFIVGRKQLRPPPNTFTISGVNLTRPLRPGTSQALDLKLTHPHRYSLAITRLTVVVVVDRAHARAGCDARRDFRVTAIPRRSYPIRLRPRRRASLRGLGARVLPRVEMVALPRNQDACKGARLTVKVTGTARRWGVRRRR
jgi:hypothetical protein